MKYIAEYQCLKCNHKYQNSPGPTQCPKCSHLFVKWINYEELRKQWDELNQSGSDLIG